MRFRKVELIVDYSRVVLKSTKDHKSMESHYINANFIKVMRKCVDYFQTANGLRDFGNVCVSTKCTKTSDSSLVICSLEVKYKQVSWDFLRTTVQVLGGLAHIVPFTIQFKELLLEICLL